MTRRRNGLAASALQKVVDSGVVDLIREGVGKLSTSDEKAE